MINEINVFWSLNLWFIIIIFIVESVILIIFVIKINKIVYYGVVNKKFKIKFIMFI